VPELREGGDNGTPITVADPESECAQAFQEIARRIATGPEAEEDLQQRPQGQLTALRVNSWLTFGIRQVTVDACPNR
jgi:MinD-like ATPase involved in chromosome partitioning or flagellar assembly